MKLTPKQRETLRMKFGGRCAYCGVELGKSFHADHVKAVIRKLKWDSDKHCFVHTGEYWAPERNTIDNLFPACRACNIHKSVLSLDSWRHELTRIVGILERNYPTFRHAVRFGRVLVSEDQSPIVFWFEKCGYSAAEPEATTDLASATLS